MTTYKLTIPEIIILNKGLNYSITNKIKHSQIIEQMEKFERRLQLKYHFYISESYGQKINKEQIRPRKIFGTIPSSFQPKIKNETITKIYRQIKTKNHM